MGNPRSPQNALAALAAKLSARGLTIDLRADGLRVTNETAPPGSPDDRKPSDRITVRADGNGQLCFYTAWGEGLAPVDKVGEAAEKVVANLAGSVLRIHW
ncbi:hypothetical protein ACFQ07_01900 [Actinomadura adrarensis]|uniref:Uncharacterized protein n=1 Tax=Actinomadura adrarensis TaxID=1819600 RepID=A0ABW3CAM1_9ACTN